MAEKIIWRRERRGKQSPKTIRVKEHFRSSPQPIPVDYEQLALDFDVPLNGLLSRKELIKPESVRGD